MTLLRNLLGTTPPASGDAPNVEDVFSTYLYTSPNDSSTFSVNNGIDLDGEGGMVWLKVRNYSSGEHLVFDTERPNRYPLKTNATQGEHTVFTQSNFTFSSTGFGVTDGYGYDLSFGGYDYTSWTFRKAPRFFDVVTYTGSGGGQSILHDLGIAPGMVLIKRTDSSGDWGVWHRKASGASDGALILNSTDPKYPAGVAFGSTSSSIVVYDTSFPMNANQSGASYVAYIFAHDPDGENDDGMIACGSFTTGSSPTSNVVSLGWEPQYIMYKNSTSAEAWNVYDSTRGMPVGGNDALIFPNSSAAETEYNNITLNADGFTAINNTASKTYIYMAIRAPMMKEPEAGTDVFAQDTSNSTGDNKEPAYRAPFPVDMAINSETTGNHHETMSRLTQGKRLYTNLSNAQDAPADAMFDYSNGYFYTTNTTSQELAKHSHMFKRAKGFFDVVAYTGNGVAGYTVNHSLGVVPEMMWVKRRDVSVDNWSVYHKTPTATDFQRLNYDQGFYTSSQHWNSTEPTSSAFSLGNVSNTNTSGSNYIAYLFATVAGVSKVGSFTGNGSNQNIACGFSGGARFVLIKRTDSTGDWFFWDTERGINTGNDPHLSLNTTAAEVTSDDSIDPQSAGFTVNQVSATNINVSSATYIFLAIA